LPPALGPASLRPAASPRGERVEAGEVYTVACCVSFTEEPDERNLHVRFCEGH